MIDAARGAANVPVPPRAASEVIEPFLFGSDDKPLYGCLHRAMSRSTKNRSVLLCQPVGPEYIRSHRAMRQLAGRLSRAGLAVMRFDFYGCGDSSGDDEQGDVPQWTRDVNSAIDELRERTDPDEVAVIGLRLGGSLAALAGAQRRGIDRMVLWDPVVSGTSHLEELRGRHCKHLEFLPTRTGNRAAISDTGGNYEEVLGFRFGSSLLTTLPKLDLATLAQSPARKMLVIESQAAPVAEPLAARLKSLSGQVEYQHQPDHEIWMAAPDRGVVPGQILQSIISWVTKSE